MAVYFNKTRGPITVSLKTGEAAMVPPKGILDVTVEQDGSASLHAMVRRGLLVHLKTPIQVNAPPAPIAASPEPSAWSVLNEESSQEFPSKQWTKGHLIEYAESKGLEIETSWTKVEILEAIEEAGR